MNPLIRPPRLSSGDRIGVISPGGPVLPSELEPGLELLRESGFEVCLAPHLYARKGYLAGRDEERLDDLHAMFEDPETKGIICARGGYGSMRLLDRIRFDLITESPKILVGYSDITALLLAVTKMTGLVTFHGSMVKDLTLRDGKNWEMLRGLLTGSEAWTVPLDGVVLRVRGRAKGVLLGGNLSLICHLVGTPFLPSLDGCILFLEDKGEPLYRVDRMMTHLRLSGHLQGIAGLIAGDFGGCGDPGAIGDLLEAATEDLGIPVATGLPSGHGTENRPLPLGAPVAFDADHGVLRTQQCPVL
jgi:muramoyltetrapeptide carboxypeptidase